MKGNTHHNDAEHNDMWHNGLHCDIQQTAEQFLTILLSVVMLNVGFWNVIKPSAVKVCRMSLS